MAKTSFSGPGNLHTLVSVLRCSLCFQRIPFKNILEYGLATCFLKRMQNIRFMSVSVRYRSGYFLCQKMDDLFQFVAGHVHFKTSQLVTFHITKIVG